MPTQTAIRRWLAATLRTWATAIDVPLVVPVSGEPDYLVLARVLTAEQTARWPERAGEAKRHQVYARLLKDFPDVPHRVLSRAIEDALPS